MKIAFINCYPQPNSKSGKMGAHSIEMIMHPLIDKLKDYSVEVEEINLDNLIIKPCEGCTEKIDFIPSIGCDPINDDMNSLYPILRESDIWIFAISLNHKAIPKKLYDFIDRLEPLFNSMDINLENSLTQLTFNNSKGKIFLLSTSELWGKEVFSDLTQQIQTLALLFSKNYFGEILRPHFGVFVSAMEQNNDFAKMVDDNLSLLAKDLIHSASISNGYLEHISQDLISKKLFDEEIGKILGKVI
ncbi:MAG: hypothetical protein A2X64_02180 [Ignavibacteria bacterium GWF2_33_9]|nr:MAG: hypothetical protein A2X64_02180 [Ignavibacteria bacterium GWF2_33_9]